MRSFFALFLLASCGGEPFELGGLSASETSPGSVIDAGAPAETGSTIRFEAAIDAAHEAEHEAAVVETSTKPVAEDSVEAAVVEASVVETSVEVSAPQDTGCAPMPSTVFGCGPPISVQSPNQYCVDQWNAPDAGTPAIAVPMPAACQCAGTYNCGCLLGFGLQLCKFGKYVSCSTGTTGGVVVVCR